MNDFFFFYILILVLDNESDELNESKDDTGYRIIQGHPIAIEKVPYQAALEKLTQLWCGGVIIDKDIILTAAHCVISPKKSENKDDWWLQLVSKGKLYRRVFFRIF